MRHSALLSSVLAALLLGACSDPVAPATASAEKRMATLVKVAAVRAGKIEDRWRFHADVRAASRASLAAGAAGAVTKVLVREGDAVAAGQLLVEVDPALAVARLQVAEAGLVRGQEVLAQAKRERDRLEGLAGKVVAAVELERARSRAQQAEADLRSLEAALAEAKAQLALHRIRAPFNGAVAKRQIDQGDWVRPGDPALELVSTEQVEVLLDGSAELLRHVSVGTPAMVIGASRVPAEVAGVVPALDPVTRTLRIRLRPQEAAPWLIAGAPAEVEFSVDLSDQGVVVSRDALLVAPTETKIVRVVGDKAEFMAVEVISKAGDDVLIRAEGLALGDQVVVRGNERLRPGQEVKVTH